MKLLAKWACTLFVVGAGSVACSAASQVSDVYMALDTNGDRPRNVFFTDTKQISCNVDWVGRNPDMTVQGQFIQTWSENPPGSGALQECPTQPDGRPGCALMGANEQAGPEGEATLSFTWTQQSASGGGKEPYPVGRYECRIFVNGESAGIAQFEVQYPDGCPADTAAVDGAACAGWVKLGATCRDAADFTKTCTCGGATWSCQ